MEIDKQVIKQEEPSCFKLILVSEGLLWAGFLAIQLKMTESHDRESPIAFMVMQGIMMQCHTCVLGSTVLIVEPS